MSGEPEFEDLSEVYDNVLSNPLTNGELKSNMDEDEGRSKATVDFVVENFSHIKDAVFSEPCMIKNFPWRIMVMQRPGNTEDNSSSKSLGFFVQCNGESESSSWSCLAKAQLIILSQKQGVDDFCRKIQHKFYSEENDWGFSHFMSWNEVMNPERGYIKDDAIILRAVVETIDDELLDDTASSTESDMSEEDDNIVPEDNGIVPEDNGIVPEDNDIVSEDNNFITDKGRSKATFDFVIENLSSIKGAVLSGPCMIRNFPWRIMVMQRLVNTTNKSSSKSLGVFLQCNAESECSSWSCFAEAQLVILSQKEGIENFSRKIQHLFYSKENDWGFSHFMSWNEVTNPERGFIKDDVIVLRAVVDTTPSNLSPNYELLDNTASPAESDLSESEDTATATESDMSEGKDIAPPTVFKGKSKATFEFVIENLSSIKDAVLSVPCMIENFPWRIMVMQRLVNTTNKSSSKSLGVFLQCNGESECSAWSCFAEAQLVILSQKEGVEDFSRKIQHLFCSKENDWGFSHFMSWNEVIDSNRGYIKNNRIILRAVVETMLNNPPINEELLDNTVTATESDMSEGEDAATPTDFNVFNDEGRSTATFDFVIENLSSIKGTVLSGPCMIRNFPWRIMVMQRPVNTTDKSSSKSLGVFLQCNGESECSSWSCFAKARLIILSQKEGVEDFSRQIQHLFYSKENDWGFSHFMSWNEVMNPERGYIKDDAIVLRAVVETDPLY